MSSVGEYSFCETATAGAHSPWHIRRLTAAGRKLGGGADTPALCGRVVAWDLRSPIKLNLLQTSTCPKCSEIFSKEIQPNLDTST